MRSDKPEGTEKKLDSDHVACPKCEAPMAIVSISINAVTEQITYRCEPCKTEKIVTNQNE